MRIGRLGLAIAATLALIAPAAAENRVFIIVNHADGYGVDRCLATGATCGAPRAIHRDVCSEHRRLGVHGLIERLARAAVDQRPEILAEGGRRLGKGVANDGKGVVAAHHSH